MKLTQRWPFLLAAGVLCLDRASKHIIETRVPDWETHSVIPGFFQIVHTRNTGIAFGLFAGDPSDGSSPLLLALVATVLLLVAGTLWKVSSPGSREHWTLRMALGFVLGGAVGNVYDRVVFGSVTDFLDFYWGARHFPVFNVADSAITTGAFLLLLNLWFTRHEHPAARAEEAG